MISIAAAAGSTGDAVDPMLPQVGVASIEPEGDDLFALRQRRDRRLAEHRAEQTAGERSPEDLGRLFVASQAPAPQTSSTDASVRFAARRRKAAGHPASVTSETPLAANFASTSGVTIPAPDPVEPQGPQHSALTATPLPHRSRNWQHSRFINSLAVA